MADANNTPVFEAFNWTHDTFNANGVTAPARVLAEFASIARDVGQGVDTVLALLEHDMCAEGSDERPILNVLDQSHLLRLARRSSEMLRDESERLTEWVRDYHTPEGIKSRAAPWGPTTQRQST